MTIGIVQSVGNAIDTGNHTSNTATLPSTPTAGNLLVLIAISSTGGGTTAQAINPPVGWTTRRTYTYEVGPNAPSMLVATKTAGVGEGPVTVTFGSGASQRRSNLHVYEFNGSYGGDVAIVRDGFGDSPGFGTSHAFPAITPTASAEAYLLGAIVNENAYGVTGGPGGGYSNVLSTTSNDGASDTLNTYGQHVASASGAYGGGTITYSSGCVTTSVQVWIGVLAVAPVADFTYVGTAAGTATDFTDASTGGPTSWLWDFGDGNTSTSQHPSHVYASPGSYNVTLTATNATGSDAETKTLTIVIAGTPDPPEPAGVLLEIYAAAPGSARWDVAKWDEGLWGEGGWRDVTPYGVTVDIDWGSSRPNDGILSVPDAASWAVDYYDPGRILDPANEDGPYFGDLIPYLPIRVSHRGTVIRQGFATGISHNYAEHNGYMRGADNITRLANAQVPSDTALSDTLYARAVDAIAAAGLDVQVVIPPGTDPPVSPWVTGTREWSVWQWVKDAAQEVLYIPIIDRLNRLTFRPWASPLLRGRSITAPEMIDLAAVTDYEGMYSVVRARQDVSTIIERALTPPPRYGARTYTRDEITIDPDVWAEAVLADRSFSTVRWVPGQIYPLTAVSVENFATMEAVEQVTLTHLFTDPTIIETGVIVGGNILVRPKYDSTDAKWRFTFQVAASEVVEPLTLDGGGPTDYLTAEDGVEFLYPDS